MQVEIEAEEIRWGEWDEKTEKDEDKTKIQLYPGLFETQYSCNAFTFLARAVCLPGRWSAPAKVKLTKVEIPATDLWSEGTGQLNGTFHLLI